MCTTEHRRQRGLTLIELIVFIIIVSVALVGLLSVFNVSVRGSADPMIRKQMLSIAEALLEEVELQPYCSASDTNCANASTGGTCTSASRTALGQVGDYAGCNLPSPIYDAGGTDAAPAGYSATIAVAASALNGADTALITVTVCRSATLPCGTADSVVLQGYRARYWPDKDASW
jgi:MSHA pilin protein MshD